MKKPRVALFVIASISVGVHAADKARGGEPEYAIAFASFAPLDKDIFLADADPQSYGEIYVMRADGSDVRALTDNQYEEATPNWIPVRGK